MNYCINRAVSISSDPSLPRLPIVSDIWQRMLKCALKTWQSEIMECSSLLIAESGVRISCSYRLKCLP